MWCRLREHARRPQQLWRVLSQLRHGRVLFERLRRHAGLGIDICRNTIANVLNEAGIVPAPERDKQRTWQELMRSRWESLYACDLFAVETLGLFGPLRHMVFFVVKLETHEVHIAGIRINPDGAWMKQIGPQPH